VSNVHLLHPVVSVYLGECNFCIHKEVNMCIEEVSISNEILKKAEASEKQSQAEYVSSGEFLKKFIRRIELKPRQGGTYGK
jgi:hypothetical protein